MIKDFLNNLKADFSNIDEVYNLLLKKYNPDNVNTTAVTFIDSIDFDNVQQSNNVSKLSLYLGKQRNKVQWQLLDYYNHYITTKRFGFFNLGERKKNEFNDFSNNLIEYKTQYDYIFNKLTDIKKIEFANDYLDKLKKLNDFQKFSKHKAIIQNMIIEIENNFKNYKLNTAPQQIESSKPKKHKKSLLEFINNIKDKEAFIQELKKTFQSEQGKSIKAIVLKLNEVNILIYGTKEFRQFYNELQTYFNRDIGTYQSINDVKTVDKETTATILKKLDPLIIKHQLM